MLGIYINRSGHILARGALGLTAYLARPELWARGGADRIFRRFLDTVPRDRLTFLSTSLMPVWRGIDERALPEVIDTLSCAGVPRPVRHLFWMRVANDPGAPALGFTYTEIDPERTERAGVLEITLPETWDPQALFELALEIVNTAPVHSLVGGYVFRYDVHDESPAFHQIYEWARRYLGMDIQKADDMAWLAPRALPGSNWITYIGGSVAAAAEIDLGSLRDLGDDVIAIDVAGGLMLRAGGRPLEGDVERMCFPLAYAKVARALDPWFANPPPEFFGAFFQQRHTQLWLRRLVDPAAWVDRKIEHVK
jgi:hypothetical protein